MSEITQAPKKQGKKDTKIDQWAEIKDPFVNQLYKRLRGNQKKMNQIKEVEQKIKAKEIIPNQEQLDMVQRKDKVKAEMDEVLGYLSLYKESFTESSAFAAPAKKSTLADKIVEVVVQEETLDINKVIEDALHLVADAVIFGTLNADQGVELKGSTQNLNDSIAHVVKAWSGLTEGLGTWSSAKGNFVDTFSRLISKSATQVGTNTSRTYADLHTFITAFSTSEGEILLQIERTVSLSPAGQTEEQYLEEEKLGAEGTQVENKEGEVGLLGEERNERGGFRGNRRGGERGNRGNFRGGYFRKHNQDDEGFVVVKDDEGSAHQNHYPSRRQRGGARGEFRGNRGGEFRGGEHRGSEFRGERRVGEFRGGEHREFRGERRTGEFRGGEHRGSEFRGERRGGEHRGNRGGAPHGDRPWTEHKPREHRGRGDVRTTEFEAPATTEAPVAATQAAAVVSETTTL